MSAAGFLEVAVRLLPTNEHPRPQPDREFTWSKGWDFAIRTEKRSDNHGFLNRLDYSVSSGPLLAVIDDSYVEAAQAETRMPCTDSSQRR